MCIQPRLQPVRRPNANQDQSEYGSSRQGNPAELRQSRLAAQPTPQKPGEQYGKSNADHEVKYNDSFVENRCCRKAKKIDGARQKKEQASPKPKLQSIAHMSKSQEGGLAHYDTDAV